MSLRIGLITALDPAGCKARVRFPDHDGVESYWLQVMQPRTKHDRAYWMPSEGEQVVCIMDQGEEAGVVAGSIYGGGDTPPASDAAVQTIVYGGGGALTWDGNAGAFSLNVGGVTVTVSAAGVAIEGGSVTHNGTNIGDTHVHGGIRPGSADTAGPK